MKNFHLVLIAAITFFLTGCPYRSDQPAQKKSNPDLDRLLPGAWLACAPKEPQDCVRMFVYRFSEGEYYVETSEVGYKDDGREVALKTDRYRAFPAAIGPIAVMDVQDLSLSTSAAAGNSYFRPEFTDTGELRISYVSDGLVKEKFDSPAALGKYFEANMNKPGFFEPFAAFRRLDK